MPWLDEVEKGKTSLDTYPKFVLFSFDERVKIVNVCGGILFVL